MKEDIFEVQLKSTKTFLKKLFSKNEFEIKSKYPSINNLKCTIEKGNNCFKFSTDTINLVSNIVDYQDKQYGYLDEFSIINNEYNLNVFKGLGLLKIKLKGLTCEGEIRDLKTNNFTNGKSYFRSLIPLNGYILRPYKFIETKGFKVKNSFRSVGYFKINIDNINIGIYDYDVLGIEYLIIESYDEVEAVEFERLVLNILHSYAFISGYLIREEIITLEFENNSFEKIKSFKFEKLKKSIISIPSIDNRLFNELSDNFKVSLLSPKIFEKIILNNKKDIRIFRTIKIINESPEVPIEIIASTFSVALETIKNVIIEEYEEKINPFKDKRTAREIIRKLKDIISPIEENKFNNKNAVINKIEQLNQVGNKESFLLCFKLLDIKLSDDEINCLSKRNDFLHGRIPFEDENDDFELQYIVYKLHQLVSSLILKKADYNGLVLNNAKYKDYERERNKLKEKLFIKI